MPPFSADMVSDLRELAEASSVACGIPRDATIEWRAADAIEATWRALLDISTGATDPRIIAAIALILLEALEGTT